MATIDANVTIFEGYNITAEKLTSIQGEIFQNLEVGEFQNYLLSELDKIKMSLLDYQQEFANSTSQKGNISEEIFGLLYNGYIRFKERIEALKDDIYNNLPSSDFKDYLLEELSKIQMLILTYQQTFNNNYCPNNKVKNDIDYNLQLRIDEINEKIKKDGLSL